MSAVCIREYKEEDLEKVHHLYNSRLSDHVHFSRDVKFIEHFIHFPVAKKRIYVAISEKEKGKHGDEIVGFIIVAIGEKRGYVEGIIAELCSINESVTKGLVQKAVTYCIEEGVDIIAAAGFLNENVAAFGKSEGWFEANPYLMMGIVGSPLAVLQSFLKPKLGLLKSFVNGILFIVDDKMIHVTVRNEFLSANLIEENRASADYVVRMNNKVFSALVIGRKNPYVMYFRRKIRIRKMVSNSSIFQDFIYKYKILKLIASLRIRKALRMAIIDIL